MPNRDQLATDLYVNWLWAGVVGFVAICAMVTILGALTFRYQTKKEEREAQQRKDQARAD